MLTNITTGQQLNEANRMLLLSKYEDAKREIDKVFADAKANDNPEALLLRVKIYAEIFYDSLLRAKYPDAGDESYRSLGKYIYKDPSLKSFFTGNGMRSLSIIYTEKFKEGYKLFTDGKWDAAFASFTVAEDLGDFIAKNGLGKNKQNIDTVAVVYAGFAAQNAKKTDRAMFYYRKFAAEKIGGQDYIDIYRYLLYTTMVEKEADDFKKYLALARNLYPKEEVLWNAYEAEYKKKNPAW
ncbi:MAG: hypothetical protein DI535_18960 [Citrobacter freundii]|nr:MAG: hypothetical protein DI535_18960 [Citrobacter freundii]